MTEFRFTWIEKWQYIVEAETFEEAQEQFSNATREEMGFCDSDNYEVTVSESDMSRLIGG
jgi:hypothetical protein